MTHKCNRIVIYQCMNNISLYISKKKRSKLDVCLSLVKDINIIYTYVIPIGSEELQDLDSIAERFIDVCLILSTCMLYVWLHRLDILIGQSTGCREATSDALAD